jgi:hypothetical protein
MTASTQGQRFDPDEEKLLEDTAKYWQQVWNEAPIQALTRIEDAAKQMIVITTGLQGLYVAIFAFSTIRVQVRATLGDIAGSFILLLFFLPLACWLMSLFYAIRVFVPRVRLGVNFNEVSVNAWQKVKDVYRQASEEKLHWLQYSHRWLVASFVVVLIAIVVFILLPTAPT